MLSKEVLESLTELQLEGALSRLMFKSRRNKDGCLIWNGPKSGKGYGAIKAFGVQWQTHRLMWFLKKMSLPSGFHVLHHCDVKPCMEIEHLFLGSCQDNNDDYITKNGGTTIERVEVENIDWARSRRIRRILNSEDVAKAIKLRSEGWTYGEVAQEVGCSLGKARAVCIENGASGKTYQKWDESNNKIAIELFKDGWNWREIAEKLGVGMGVLYNNVRPLLRFKESDNGDGYDWGA